MTKATKVAIESLETQQLNDLMAVFKSMAVLQPQEAELRAAVRAELAKRRLAKSAKSGAELLKKLV